MNNQSVSINWEEPPVESIKRVNKWDEIASALRANPGRWAKVAENKTNGYVQPLKKRGSFEFMHVTAGLGYKRGSMDVYARFPAGDSNE